MASFGKRSLERLNTVHPDLQKVMHEAIKSFDITVICGNRSIEEQQKLYSIGRVKKGDEWETTGRTVTNIDGINKRSKHNYVPSLAIDIAPYPIDWEDIDRFNTMVQIVKNASIKVGVKIECGADWKMRDYPHFQLS